MRKKRRVKSTKAKLEAFKKRREMDLERFEEDVNKDALCKKKHSFWITKASNGRGNND